MSETNGFVTNVRKGLFTKPPRPLPDIVEEASELFQIDPPRTSDEFTTRAMAAHLKRKHRSDGASQVDAAAAQAKEEERKLDELKREAARIAEALDRQTVAARHAEEKAAEEKRVADEKAAEQKRMAEQRAVEQKAADDKSGQRRPGDKRQAGNNDESAPEKKGV